jgi:hypothetical protein
MPPLAWGRCAMDKVALWLGYAVLLAGGVGLCAVCLWLAAEGVWRAWRAWRGFFNIVAAFDALREKQQAAHGVSASDGKTQAGASAPKAAVPEVERDAEVAGVILNLRDDAHRLRNGSEFTTAQIADDLDLLADRLAATHPTTAKE